MKLTIEFESEWWRVEAWWHRTLCDWFGHPGWEEPSKPRGGLFGSYLGMMIGDDPRRRCIRCGVPDPTQPEPEPVKHTFTFVDSAFDFPREGDVS